MFFFQATEKSFGIRNTGLTAVEIVLLAFLGNRLHDSVFTGHNISAVAASMTRHLAFCFADIHYVVIETQGCVLRGDTRGDTRGYEGIRGDTSGSSHPGPGAAKVRLRCG